MKYEGNCWLCGEFRQLTKEHIPPHSAFNDHEIFLQAIDERARDVSHVVWKGDVVNGWIVRSLCAECNNEAGRKYGSHYVEFIKQIAEKVDKVQDGEAVSIVVNRPLSVLKQVMQNFVSANGQHFAKTHQWIRRFLRSSRNKDFPPDWYVYVYAITSKSGRKSGVSGFYDLIEKRICVVAEFTFWPLGTVLAFQPMDNYRLAPIHHYASYDYTESKAGLHLHLPVNPASSAYPVDFRTKQAIMKDRNPTQPYKATEEQGKQMLERVFKYAAKEDEDGFIFSGHPETFAK
jgi:hypothetical protein